MAYSSETSSTPASLLTQQIAFLLDREARDAIVFLYRQLIGSIDSMKEILLVFSVGLLIAR